MRAVGIDPGTACGYAWCDGNEPALHQSGVWDLSEGRHSGGGMRFLRLRQYLLELIQGSELVPLRAGYKPVCAVFYEEVARHRGVAAAHVYGGIVATIGSVCEERGVPYMGIPVKTIKKLATGSGNAGKPQMVLAAHGRWGLPLDASDDQADALWVLAAGLAELGLCGG